MNLSFNCNLSQNLNLHLSHRQNIWLTQQQAIPIMQCSITDLETLIVKELEENPELNREEPFELPAKDHPTETTTVEKQDWVEELERMGQDSWDDWNSYTSRGQRKDSWSQVDSSYYENSLRATESLYGVLFRELQESYLGEEEQRIGSYLIGEIDDRGLLSSPLEPMAIALGVKLTQVEHVLAVIQEFAPVGVGARSVQECLLLQLRSQGNEDSLAGIIVCEYWDELLSRKFSQIARQTGTYQSDITKALGKIGCLDRSPGRSFGLQEIAVVPDAFIRQISDGGWQVTVNKGESLGLKVNIDSADAKDSQEVADFYQNLRQKAASFVKSIAFRHETLLAVVSAVVERQKEYFEKGAEYLVPLTQSEIAEEFDLSEATISRMVNQKYVQTPTGVVALKYFFDSGVNTFDGNCLAAEAVKTRIRKMVAKENREKPFSDQTLTNCLRFQGVDISCRGVNKYRQGAGIGSTRERRWV